MALKLLTFKNVLKTWAYLISLILLSSCKGNMVSNKLYLPIKNDSQNTVFFQFYAKGGERHISLIDWGEDALPTSAGSCHHGGEILPPQKGSIKAHTDLKNLYLDIYWDDKTKDVKQTIWDDKNHRWKEGKDDGIAIIFSKNSQFDCTTTCHMINWQVGESKFSSDYQMYTKDGNVYPIIILRAKKTDNRPILAVINKNGKETPFNEPIYELNSLMLSKKPITLLSYQSIKDDDQPKYSDNKSLFILNTNNFFLNGKMNYSMGGWHAHIEVPLDKIGFPLTDRNDKIFMAIAIFDNTHANHSITKTFYATYE